MREVMINNRWPIVMPDHKADLPIWPWWEFQRLQAMRVAIRLNECVWDVGAEQGDLSALVASWLGPEGQMVLFEPVARSWPAIRTTYEANNLLVPHCFVGFASDQTLGAPSHSYTWPECSLADIDPEPGFQHLVEHRTNSPISQIRLDDALSHFRVPTVISMDIEGAELRALVGADRLLREVRPIWFISVHAEMMRESYNDTPDDLQVHMGKFGYEGVYLGYDHEQHWVYMPRAS